MRGENWVLSAGTMERISKLFSLKNNPIRDHRSAVPSNEALTKTFYALFMLGILTKRLLKLSVS
jgi:hypothetical protein